MSYEEELMREAENKRRKLSELETQEAPSLANVIERSFFKTGITDNVVTSVFRVATVDETGSTDGGGYAVFVHALVGHALANNAGNAAVKSFTAHYGRVMISSGAGVNTAVSEISETASAASTGATRDISTVTMTVVETSEYNNDVQFQIDLTGSGVTTAQVICFVRVIWYGFLTPPTLSQL